MNNKEYAAYYIKLGIGFTVLIIWAIFIALY